MGRVTDDLSAPPAWYAPALADFVFVAVLLAALRIGHDDLLNDPGTTWHIQIGIDTWESGPPQRDPYSYTRGGEPWIAQTWLFDMLLAAVYRLASWNGVAVAAALLLACTYRALLRTIFSEPANAAWAVLLALLAAGCGATHWLARPHLLSLWFFVLTYQWCRDYHRDGTRTVYFVPALMALWCNIHGGFVAGGIVVACSLAGHLLTAPRDPVWRVRAVRFAIVLGLSAIATLINPYGWRLHAHVTHLLFTSGVRDLIDEWRAPDFQSPDMRPFTLLLLLAVVMLAWSRRRVSVFSLAHVGFWLHAALTSVRQVPFAAIVAASVLGGLSGGWLSGVAERLGWSGSTRWHDALDRRLRDWDAAERSLRWPLWSGVAAAIACALAVQQIRIPALGLGMARLSPERWPIAAVERLNEEPRTGPLFNDLNWGGYLILLSNPRRPVFADDRFELYGREFLVDYLDALQIGPSWKRLDEQYHFEFVLVRPDAPLARTLRDSPDWEILHADKTANLLSRRPAVRVALDSTE